MHRTPVWAFDVDGTVIGSIRSDVLRPGVGDLLVELTARGVRCVLWSAGGGVYAQRMAESHGIVHHFEAFYAKRDRGPDGRFSVDHFSRADRPTVFVDDAPAEIPAGGKVVAVPQFMGGNPADGALVGILHDIESLVPTRS